MKKKIASELQLHRFILLHPFYHSDFLEKMTHWTIRAYQVTFVLSWAPFDLCLWNLRIDFSHMLAKEMHCHQICTI